MGRAADNSSRRHFRAEKPSSAPTPGTKTKTTDVRISSGHSSSPLRSNLSGQFVPLWVLTTASAAPTAELIRVEIDLVSLSVEKRDRLLKLQQRGRPRIPVCLGDVETMVPHINGRPKLAPVALNNTELTARQSRIVVFGRLEADFASCTQCVSRLIDDLIVNSRSRSDVDNGYDVLICVLLNGKPPRW